MGIYNLITSFSELISGKIPYFSVSFVTAIVYIWLAAFLLLAFDQIFKRVKFKHISNQNLIVVAFSAIFVIFIVDYFIEISRNDFAYSQITKIKSKVEQQNPDDQNTPTFSIELTDPKTGRTATLRISTNVTLDQNLSTSSTPTFQGLYLTGNLNLGTNNITFSDGRQAVTTTGGSTNYIPKFNSSDSLTNSIIYATSYGIGLHTSNILEAINIDGRIYLTDAGAPTSTTNKLYNASGNLFWNNINLTAGGAYQLESPVKRFGMMA